MFLVIGEDHVLINRAKPSHMTGAHWRGGGRMRACRSLSRKIIWGSESVDYYEDLPPAVPREFFYQAKKFLKISFYQPQPPYNTMAESHRLYVKGKHLSYQRSKNVNHPGTSLIQIEGVGSTQDARFYLGKRIAYVYRAQKEIRGSKIRVIWGKVTRTHGNNGVVRANFKRNLPPKTFGASVRIMLYPSNI